MNENLGSLFMGTAGLSVAAAVALMLTVLRKPIYGDLDGWERTGRLFLIGLAAQCLHFMEEFVTRFQVRFPALLSLPPWSDNSFVIFNLTWLIVWILSAVGLSRGSRIALFPIWFFAVASVANGIAHPVLAIVAGGYFPGLITSPIVGTLGLLLWQQMLSLTRS